MNQLDANAARLYAAGYRLSEAGEDWFNETLDRALDAGVARELTPQQLDTWIAAGTKGRESTHRAEP